MLLRIVSVEWELYSGKIEKVTLPSEKGILWILPGHINLVTTLMPWSVAYLPDVVGQSALEQFTEQSIKIPVQGWLAMIEDDVVTVVIE